MTRDFKTKVLQGRFSGILHWHDLTALWDQVRREPAGWFIYQVGEPPPQAPLSPEALNRFLDELDGLLRREHDEDYCGIVYADSTTHPTLVKVYDLHNLGSSCGGSGQPIPPRWVISREPPVNIEEVVTPQGRRRWWRRLFKGGQTV